MGWPTSVTDGNWLVSNFGMDIWNVNRLTGKIMWHPGGWASHLSFVGVNLKQALTEFSDNKVTRLANGDDSTTGQQLGQQKFVGLTKVII